MRGIRLHRYKTQAVEYGIGTKTYAQSVQLDGTLVKEANAREWMIIVRISMRRENVLIVILVAK